jgi:hypothetical protein
MSKIAKRPRAPLPNTALDDALARYDTNLAAYRDLSEKMRHPNRVALFDALSATRISLIIVTFGGDVGHGRIAHLTLIADDCSARLPLGPVTLSIPQWGLPEPLPLKLTIPHAIERMAYDCLEQSYGTCEAALSFPDKLVFNVASRSIGLAPCHRGKANG